MYLKSVWVLQEKKRQEAAAKKAEAKKLAEEEAAQLANSAKKSATKSAGTPKVRTSGSRWTQLRTLLRKGKVIHRINTFP